MEKLMFREAEARERLGGMSRDTIFRLIRSGDLKAVHVGRALYIPASALGEFVDVF